MVYILQHTQLLDAENELGRLQEHKSGEYTHAALRIIAVFGARHHHHFYKLKLWDLSKLCMPLVCGHVLRLRQFDSIVLISCKIAVVLLKVKSN